MMASNEKLTSLDLRELDTTLMVTPCSQSQHNNKKTIVTKSSDFIKNNNESDPINKPNTRKIQLKKFYPSSTQNICTRSNNSNLANKKLTKTLSLSSDTISQQQQQYVKYNNDMYSNSNNSNNTIRNSCKFYRNQIACELENEKNYSFKNNPNIIDRRNSIDNSTIRSSGMIFRKPADQQQQLTNEINNNNNTKQQQHIINRLNDRNKYKIIKTMQNNQIKENAPKSKFLQISTKPSQSTITDSSQMFKKNSTEITANDDFYDTKLKSIDDRIRKHKLQMKMSANLNDKIKISNYYVDKNKKSVNYNNGQSQAASSFLKGKLSRTKSQTDTFFNENYNDFISSSNNNTNNKYHRVNQTHSNYGIISASDLLKLRAP